MTDRTVGYNAWLGVTFILYADPSTVALAAARLLEPAVPEKQEILLDGGHPQELL